MPEAKHFLLEIVTPERKIFSEQVDFAIFRGADGEFGVLPDHAPLLSALKPGTIKFVRAAAATLFNAAEGFVEVLENKVTVAVETCEPAAQKQ